MRTMCELRLGVARGFSSGLCRMLYGCNRLLGNVGMLRYLDYLLNYFIGLVILGFRIV